MTRNNPLEPCGAIDLLKAYGRAAVAGDLEGMVDNGGALIARLRAAEDALTMWSWTGSTQGPNETDREKAVHELWLIWCEHVPPEARDPKSYPHLNEGYVKELADKRRETVRNTLQRIQGVLPEKQQDQH